MASFTETVLAQKRSDVERRYREGTMFVYPRRITMALDLCQLYGPEVDVACLAVEPAVDLWEAGHAAPSWEQLTALAALTETPISFFFVETPERADGVTWVCGEGGCQTVEDAPHPEPFDGKAWAPVIQIRRR